MSMFELRIKLLQDALSSHEIDSLLITSPYNIAYLTGIHAFSIEEREARILVTKDTVYLFTDARYSEMIKGLQFLTFRESNAKAPFLKQIEEIVKKEKITKLGIEEENISYKEFVDLEESLDKELIPSSDVVEQLRQVKDTNEIENLRNACHLTDRAFEFIVKHLKPGMTELKTKTFLENFIRQEEGELAFSSIVAFGKNSAIPHHMSGITKLQERDIVLLDFGAKVNGYCADMTRTVFLKDPSKNMYDVYKVTLESQEVALDYLKQHMVRDFVTKNVHEYATSHIRASGFPAIPHAIGHGVGLQVHELPTLSPYSDESLTPGMVVTVEPGIYIPEVGGVRIEDTVLITPDGYELLTKSPKELTVI